MVYTEGSGQWNGETIDTKRVNDIEVGQEKFRDEQIGIAAKLCKL